MVQQWLKQDYVAEFWYGAGLQNTLASLSDFINGKRSIFTHWVAYDEDVPFGFLMTSEINIEKDLPYSKYCSANSKAITLDLLIGRSSYLGKSFGSQMIKEFLKQEFNDVTDVFIDPGINNHKAIHVYEKAGFTRLEKFIPDWDISHPCLLMHLKLISRLF